MSGGHGPPLTWPQPAARRAGALDPTRVHCQSGLRTLNPDGFDELEAWLHQTRMFWSRRLDALERELRADDERQKKSSRQKKA